MTEDEQKNWNRMVTAGAGAALWVALLKWLFPGLNLGYALMIAIWISMGSKHYVRTFKDFERPLKGSTLVGLALLSPAWPILYWKLKRGD